MMTRFFSPVSGSSRISTFFSMFSKRILPGPVAIMGVPSDRTASVVPATTSSPLLTRSTAPGDSGLLLLTIRMAGCFSSGPSMMMRSVSPVASSNFSSNVTSFSMSSNRTTPACSVRIERV